MEEALSGDIVDMDVAMSRTPKVSAPETRQSLFFREKLRGMTKPSPGPSLDGDIMYRKHVLQLFPPLQNVCSPTHPLPLPRLATPTSLFSYTQEPCCLVYLRVTTLRPVQLYAITLPPSSTEYSNTASFLGAAVSLSKNPTH